MVGSVRDLPATVQSQIAGVVLYGNTRNQQEKGKIPNFPTEKVLTFCEALDGVCYGGLTVTAAHLAYADDVVAAGNFLEQRIAAAGGI
jgi:cutinase